MSDAEGFDAFEQAVLAKSRNREFDRAAEVLRRHQVERTFGTVEFHFQAGRIVRVSVTVTEKLDG